MMLRLERIISGMAAQLMTTQYLSQPLMLLTVPEV